MTKRYTIHLAIYEVDEDGDTAVQEHEGVTLDYATTDLEPLTRIMSYYYEMINDSLVQRCSNATSRRPEDEEEENDD